MRRPAVVGVAAGILLAATLAVVGARGKDPAGAGPTSVEPAGQPAPAPAPGLVRVERPRVCMVNDRDMQAEQIPVEVEGRTYYGCCPMCKDRLANDKTVRSAKDPVTGRTVDKAKAVIGRLPAGSVLYFESEATFARYAPPAPAAR